MLLQFLAEQGVDVNWFDQLQAAVSPKMGALPHRDIVLRLGCAIVVGWVLGLGYRLSYTGKRVKPTMHHTLVMLCLGGAFVWLVVGNNLVRAFGLAGTIGLIRYRTTLSDPKDTTVLFFAMVMGMSIGLGQIDTAVIGCLFVFGVLVVMRLTYTQPPPKKKKTSSGENGPAGEVGPVGAVGAVAGLATVDSPSEHVSDTSPDTVAQGAEVAEAIDQTGDLSVDAEGVPGAENKNAGILPEASEGDGPTAEETLPDEPFGAQPPEGPRA